MAIYILSNLSVLGTYFKDKFVLIVLCKQLLTKFILRVFIYLNIYRKVYLTLQTGKQSSSGNLSIKIKITRASPEALLVKISVTTDKINQNYQKIPVEELIFTKVTIKFRQL